MENIKKETYIESDIDKFLEKYEDKNISTSYDDDGDKIKIYKENITKLLKKLHNKFIKDSVEKLEKFKN